jgi:hypothetical protein
LRVAFHSGDGVGQERDVNIELLRELPEALKREISCIDW